jgi:hypothetical protein
MGSVLVWNQNKGLSFQAVVTNNDMFPHLYFHVDTFSSLHIPDSDALIAFILPKWPLVVFSSTCLFARSGIVSSKICDQTCQVASFSHLVQYSILNMCPCLQKSAHLVNGQA